MRITSPAFKDGENIPELYTCDGENLPPPLEFSDVPKNAQSLVLIMTDPDASGKTFTHWLIWNISPNASGIEGGVLSEGSIQGLNSGEGIGYIGPCPPSDTHRYFFRLYALNTKLDLPIPADREMVEQAMVTHVITDASLMGLYHKKES